eukprot:CAMPEP_0204916912 /NCGR_PEP_ID=MMETSP1397-20131031/14620_1 /ASSEMBLY_ACC=CAM_ASM_000891 /TAXON_ID=49980 /ORGANISM="Climacostomum Climacostomum virens, Strain Stock W-24" /LENGTH=553 /DNA_ID=CAMNT_0052089593 /DNA_START=61 /DNA_END=1725 /DNA_ORIENTATION=+
MPDPDLSVSVSDDDISLTVLPLMDESGFYATPTSPLSPVRCTLPKHQGDTVTVEAPQLESLMELCHTLDIEIRQGQQKLEKHRAQVVLASTDLLDLPNPSVIEECSQEDSRNKLSINEEATSRELDSGSQRETARFNEPDISQLKMKVPKLNLIEFDPLKQLKPPEEILDSWSKSFKQAKAVPEALVAELPASQLKSVVELLLTEKQKLQDQLNEDKKSESYSSLLEENQGQTYSLATIQSSSAVYRLPVFPQRQTTRDDLRQRRRDNLSTYHKESVLRGIENVSPIEREESSYLKMPSNLYIPKEEDDFRLMKPLAVIDSYEQHVLQLNQEITELKTKNAMLKQLLRLSPHATKTQVIDSLSEKLMHKDRLIDRVLEENSRLKSQMAQYSERSEWHLPEETEACCLKETERQVLAALLGNAKRLDEIVYGLLAQNDIVDLCTVLIKYARHLEEDVIIKLRMTVMEQRSRTASELNLIDEVNSEKATLQAKVAELEGKILAMQIQQTRKITSPPSQVSKAHSPRVQVSFPAKPKETKETPMQMYMRSISKRKP